MENKNNVSNSFNGSDVNNSFNTVQNDHTQLGGMVMYFNAGNYHFISIRPDNPVPDQVAAFRRCGTIHQLSNGNVDVIVQPSKRSQAELIKKVAHGRVSHTIDNCVLLTVKISCSEGINISETIAEEALIAAKALRDWQLTR